MRTILVTLVLVASAGCVTQTATGLALPKERGTECVENCAKLDMDLGAVVIIANRVGCVCLPHGAPQGAATQGGAAAGTGAAIVADEEAAHAAQQRR